MRIDDFGDRNLAAAARRFLQWRKDIESAFRKAISGQVEKVESPARIRKYWQREWEHWTDDLGSAGSPMPPKPSEVGIERVVGTSNDLLSIEFLEAGQQAATAVGRITVGGMPSGTGFLIGNGLLITNQHVLPDEETAGLAELELNYEANRIGPLKRLEVFALDPERFHFFDEPHDCAIVAANSASDNGTAIEDFGYHPLIGKEGKILIGQPVNIIQHPNGRPKCICLHDSRFMFLKNDGDVDRYCWYSADTDPGSSGSPVFNNRWEVVALHHKAVPKVNADGVVLDRNNRPISEERARENPQEVQWVANEGIRASRLVRTLSEASLPAAFEEERRALLSLWERPARPAWQHESAGQTPPGQQPSHPAETATASAGTASTVPLAGHRGPPVTITIRIGDD